MGQRKKKIFLIFLLYGVFSFLWFFVIKFKNPSYFAVIMIVSILMLVYFQEKSFRKIEQELHKKNENMRFTYEELQAAYEQLVATESELFDQKSLNENIFRDANVMIGIWGMEGEILRMNPYSLELLGYSEQELSGKNGFDLFLSEDAEELSAQDYFQKRELQFKTKEQKMVDIAWNCKTITYQNRPPEVLSIGTDVTEYKRLEKKLRTVAYYDSLTGLPNRSYMEHSIRQSLKKNIPFAVAHFDIDNFKQINDTLGFEMGDLFLLNVSKSFRKSVEEPHFISRTSGDEFLVLINMPELSFSTGVERIRDRAKTVAHDLIRNIGNSWEIDNHEFFISFSVGISVYSGDGEDAHTLLKNADMAMYKAKYDKKGSIFFYTNKILDENIEKIQLSNQLRYAMKNGELMLYYQPQYHLISGKIVGLEALIRWKHPIRGFIPPAKFIPVAEETGQIYELDKWIFKSALHQKKQFEEEGRADLEISINLSSKTLASNGGLRELEKEFQEIQVDYSGITVEITETAIISDLKATIERLKRLRTLGMKVALDDFGTGYSSLTYLKDLPIDSVKLDQSFVKSIEKGGKETLIIKDVLNLAKNLKYEVIAEGIETEEQRDYLRECGCMVGQGYLMSKPISIGEAKKLI